MIRSTVLLMAVLLAGTAFAQDTSDFKNQKEKLSYALGMDLGNQFKRQSVEIDPDFLAKGLKDFLSGNKLLLTEQQVGAAIAEWQKDMQQKQQAQMAAAGEKNKAAAQEFLAKNKTAEGVVSLPSGLQYKIITNGAGQKPTLEDTVVCNYRGTLLDGTEFDSSYKRKEPVSFPVKGVIPGWTEALQLMPIGSKWMLYLPSNLAYGEQGAGNVIGPNALLIFEVELLSIKPKQ
jgi:FKBP-type peptidyl-prolyl cis-trans isomerase FklB